MAIPALFSLLLTLMSVSALAQTDSVRTFHQQDIKDWLYQKGWIKKNKEKNNFLLIVPIIASNPAAGFIFGGGLSYAYKSSPDDQRLSAVTANASYSTNKLLNLNMKSNLFVAHDRLVLNGDWRYLINYETTYGLSTRNYGKGGSVDINGYETSTDSLGQSLRYNQVRIHETGSWGILPNFFVGLGLHFDYFFNIKDQTVQDGDTAKSYHWDYSTRHGFNPDYYIISGVSLNFLYDSRDNQVNAYKGIYANLNYRMNPTWLGSTKASTLLLTEFRFYQPLDGVRQRNILGFWLYGNFVSSGTVPYLLLPALGYDQRQRTGRGYAFGRFRGEDMIYGETEYRFPISPNTGILGGVAFANVTTTSDRDNHIELFDYLRGAYGAGLRIMLDKKSRTRLEVDAGIANRKVGFYLNAQETF